MLGREIKHLSLNGQPAGIQEVEWNGTNKYGTKVSTGIYIYHIKATSKENMEQFLA